MYIKKLTEPIYRSRMILFIGDHLEFNTWMQSKYKDYEAETEHTYGCTCAPVAGEIVVFVSNKDHNNGHLIEGTIAHECFHYTNYVLTAMGLHLDEASEEAYAYLLTWTVNNVTKHYKKSVRV